MSCAVDVSDLEKISNPEMDLACKNTLRIQISTFHDMYHAIYGRLSMRTNRQTDPWLAGIFSIPRLMRPAEGQAHVWSTG